MKTGLFALLIAMSFTTVSVWAQSRAATIENITNEEFLHLYLTVRPFLRRFGRNGAKPRIHL